MAGFRPDLDLSDIMPLYAEHFGGTASINYVQPKGPIDEDTDDYADYSEHRDWRDDIPQDLFEDRIVDTEPYKVGWGPETCSTDQTLALARPTFAWDGNYWYRRLGAPFPYVHVGQGALSRAYMAGDQHDPLAMYALKMLLDDAVRFEYDRLPLGEVFMGDRYFQAWLKARAQDRASRRSAMGEFTTAEQILDEEGYMLQPDEPGDALDTQENLVDDQDQPRQVTEEIEWSYSYWSWNSGWRRDHKLRMERWQTLMVSALSVLGLRVNLAVGTMGKQPSPYSVANNGETWVAYLSDAEEPTEDLATGAAIAMQAFFNKRTRNRTK